MVSVLKMMSVLAILAVLSTVYCRIPHRVFRLAAKISILKLINDPTNIVNQKSVFPNEFPFIGGFVRLAFHDCVGAGGCDGCINHNNPDNAGLKSYTDHLDALYDKHFRRKISRADYYALAAMTALEVAAKLDGHTFDGFRFFRFGRVSCSLHPKEDVTDEDFPSANIEMKAMTTYFAKHFGFNPREVIALMGAHTLGRGRTENSGYEGTWVNGTGAASRLNNEFYKEIVDVPWIQVQVKASKKIQWQVPVRPPAKLIVNTAENRNGPPPQPTMLLNSDSALYADLHLDKNDRDACFMCQRKTREAPKGLKCCGFHTHSPIVEEFADKNKLWMSEFTKVFLKMVHKNKAFDRRRVHTARDELKDLDDILTNLYETEDEFFI